MSFRSATLLRVAVLLLWPFYLCPSRLPDMSAWRLKKPTPPPG